MIHLYTGNGKGKSTAAIGLCIRAAGWDQQVCFAQFMKGNDTGELHVLDDLQESYHEKEQLSESYMLEALASELLLMGYGAYNRYVREKRTGVLHGTIFLAVKKVFRWIWCRNCKSIGSFGWFWRIF